MGERCLNVYCKPRSHLFPLCFSLLDPPRILSLEEPELRLEHCIEFVVHGNPAPSLYWLHNGQLLRETEIIRMEFYQQGEVSEGCLLFNKPTHYNNGNYTIVATNKLGTTNQTIKGHFLATPFPGKEVHSLLALRSKLHIRVAMTLTIVAVSQVAVQ